MDIDHRIVPLHEARIYLMERLSDIRTSDRIAKLKTVSSRMNNSDFAFYDRIVKLQNELDARFETDHLIRQYFTPLKTKHSTVADFPITIGGMLLALSGEMDEPFGFDEMIAMYKSWPKERLIRFFFMTSIAYFFSDPSETESGISGFVAAADELLTDYKDKWALVDAATNPFPHLERLRPLVTNVAKEIELRSRGLEPYLINTAHELSSFGDNEKIIHSILKVKLPDEWIKDAVVRLSLFSFDEFNFYSSPYDEGAASSDSKNGSNESRVLIVGGVYMAVVTRADEDFGKAETHLDLLKKISDPMRFNILHDMCDREAYGQELAEKYKTTRSAMYYHLEKLMGIGMIELRSSEYRMLYTMNKRNVYDKLNSLRDYLLNGWKPEDDEE
ncbi:MAG: winged helix-turn-helix transcriptional regulator [Clostridia bacterium]|nr:winged helix-turn-helix transcriptional regulator [Clostridia bacterium]